jgi:LuxR family maltose regulon positive regulatory protein
MLRDPAAARPLVDEADRILAVHPKLGVLCRQRDAVAAEIDTMPSAAPGRTVRLTAAELRLLPLLATHLSFREIGAHFFLSRHTVKTQAISAYRKLGASSRSEAVQRAELLGLIERMTEAVPSLATGG